MPEKQRDFVVDMTGLLAVLLAEISDLKCRKNQRTGGGVLNDNDPGAEQSQLTSVLTFELTLPCQVFAGSSVFWARELTFELTSAANAGDRPCTGRQRIGRHCALSEGAKSNTVLDLSPGLRLQIQTRFEFASQDSLRDGEVYRLKLATVANLPPRRPRRSSGTSPRP